jgi:CRP/FNR family cyclic AMP-dependent transcriptional regulator
MDDIAILQGFRLCADLSKRELEQMAKIAVLEEHEADYHVIEENEVASTLYLVESGMVAVKMKSRGGHEVLIDELGPGELFGWSAVLNDQTFTAAVSTIEESTLIAFDGEALRRLFKKDQGIGFQVVNNIAAVVSSRLEHLRSRLADEPFGPGWNRRPAVYGREERDAEHGLPFVRHGQSPLRRCERDRTVSLPQLRDGVLLSRRLRDWVEAAAG